MCCDHDFKKVFDKCDKKNISHSFRKPMENNKKSKLEKDLVNIEMQKLTVGHQKTI